MKKNPRQNDGSIFVWVVLLISILSIAATGLLQVISSKYYSTLHTAVWQESLVAAESGVDLGLLELRKSLFPAPNNAWSGWDTAGANGNHGLITIPNAGLASTPMTIAVDVDAPPELRDPENSWQYYRIRATGTMPITGPTRAGDDHLDTRLRKLSLLKDRFTDNVLASQFIASPRVSRRIEAIVRPVSAFDQAIMSAGALDLTDHNIIIDSYDSRSALKSTNGLYDVAKRQANGNLATNGTILNAGNAQIHGSVATNSGVASGIANITGIERTDFYRELIAVGAPNWPSINPSPMVVSGSTTLTASATEGSTASRYQISSLQLAGNQVLNLAGDPDGKPTYLEIYVTGDIAVTGNGQVTLGHGVKAKFYFAGNVNIAGNGVLNKNNQPGDLMFYGINPPDANATRTFSLGGNSLLSAAVYAPSYDVEINNGGTRGSVFGSFAGKSVKMVGVTDLHYDEALGAGGVISDYKIVSWVEDNR